MNRRGFLKSAILVPFLCFNSFQTKGDNNSYFYSYRGLTIYFLYKVNKENLGMFKNMYTEDLVESLVEINKKSYDNFLDRRRHSYPITNEKYGNFCLVVLPK